MTRSSLPIAAAALAASAGLLLTACGGGGSDSSDKIQPSQTATTSAAPTATTASPTQAAGPNAPKFELPSEMKVDFKGFDDSDPAKKAALRDATYAATSVVETEALGKTKQTPNLKRFFPGEHGAQLADQMITYARSGKVATGLIRYYEPTAKLNKEAGSMTVTFCEDQSKAFDKDVKTGKVNVTTPSVKSFNAWTYVMSKSTSGEWHVFDYKFLNGAKSCQAA